MKPTLISKVILDKKKLEKIAEENPDLNQEFIIDILVAQQESRSKLMAYRSDRK